MVDRDIARELTPVLGAGEELVWTGRPKTGIVFRPSDAVMIPFSIVWCGFAIFWMVMATANGAPFFFTIFGIPFVLIGLYMVFGRFVADARTRANTLYGLSADRVIIRSGVSKLSFDSILVKTLDNIRLEIKPDGSGTIVLREDTVDVRRDAFRNFGSRNRRTVSEGPRLEFIPNVQSVYNLLLELQRKS